MTAMCELCPFRGTETTCIAVASGHRRICELRAQYGESYDPAIRSLTTGVREPETGLWLSSVGPEHVGKSAIGWGCCNGGHI